MDFVQTVVTEALKSPMANKYGAVLVHRNKIIAKGHNYDTHISTLNSYGVLCR
jgi:hypothetical protein